MAAASAMAAPANRNSLLDELTDDDWDRKLHRSRSRIAQRRRMVNTFALRRQIARIFLTPKMLKRSTYLEGYPSWWG